MSPTTKQLVCGDASVGSNVVYKMSMMWFCLLMIIGSSQAARIAGLYPTASISHQLPFQALMKALALRGHQVTVVSPDPLQEKHANYTDIDLGFTYDYWKQALDFSSMDEMSPYEMMSVFVKIGNDITELQLASTVMQDFIKSKPKFDLVLIEDLMYQSYYGLIHHFGSPPMIGLLSLGAFSPTFDAMGNPNNPSYDPDMMFPYSDLMTFWQRLNNMCFGIWMRYTWHWRLLPDQEKIMRKYFGSGPPSIIQTHYNMSLFMVNNHFSTSYPRPLLPSVIELGNLHVQTKSKPLPQDLQEFLDGAKDGFIYFSLGSNVKSDKLPAHKRQELLEAFAELPQRVLWKWESDSLPGQPSNVKISKWLPQQDVLAHPNLRLFVTQGGLQSLNEAMHHGVPVVGIPFIGDQKYNVRKIVSIGAGLKIDFSELTKELVLKTFRTVMQDPSYRENVKRLSAINKDQPETSIERAVWWTEYVLRHNGAKHMRSPALDLAWYQLLLLDVIGFIAIVLILVFSIVYLIIRQLMRHLRRYKPKED